jgi:hypothetical protein
LQTLQDSLTAAAKDKSLSYADQNVLKKVNKAEFVPVVDSKQIESDKKA